MRRRYALIGDPVAHSHSPAMQNAAFAAAGIDAGYEAIPVTKVDVVAAFAALRSSHAGLNVTTPLKELVFARVDALTPEASDARAVNTVRFDGDDRSVGHDTDGTGLIAALEDIWGINPAGMSVCVLGCGPAGRSIAAALRDAGAARVSCWSRDPARAAAIGPIPSSTPDVLVSALPAGASVPAEVIERVARAAYAIDINYADGARVLPADVGSRRSDGLPMLLHQGALAFEWWTGIAAPIDAMRAALGLAKR